MATTVESPDLEAPAEPIVLSIEESEAFFDKRCRELLGISAKEFRRRWEAGEWDGIGDEPEHWDAVYLGMMGGRAR